MGCALLASFSLTLSAALKASLAFPRNTVSKADDSRPRFCAHLVCALAVDGVRLSIVAAVSEYRMIMGVSKTGRDGIASETLFPEGGGWCVWFTRKVAKTTLIKLGAGKLPNY